MTKTDASPVTIIDSSGLIPVLNPADSDHPRATRIADTVDATSSLLVPGEVLCETLNISGKKLGRETALGIGWRVVESPTFIVAD
jgi:hypothetical protein